MVWLTLTFNRIFTFKTYFSNKLTLILIPKSNINLQFIHQSNTKTIFDSLHFFIGDFVFERVGVGDLPAFEGSLISICWGGGGGGGGTHLQCIYYLVPYMDYLN